MPKDDPVKDPEGSGGATTTQAPPKKKPKPKTPPPEQLPPWKVLLHNDDKNDMGYVVMTIVTLTPLDNPEAIDRMFEAHETGVALLLVTHKERAELYRDQFRSRGLVVTIEPDEKH